MSKEGNSCLQLTFFDLAICDSLLHQQRNVITSLLKKKRKKLLKEKKQYWELRIIRNNNKEIIINIFIIEIWIKKLGQV